MSEPFDYDEAKVDADEMIAEFGQAAVLRRPTTTGGDREPVPGPPDDYDVTIVVLGYTNREIDDTRVLATDKKVFMAVGDLAIEPATSDKLQIGTIFHSLIAPIKPLNPGGTVVLYEVQARR